MAEAAFQGARALRSGRAGRRRVPRRARHRVSRRHGPGRLLRAAHLQARARWWHSPWSPRWRWGWPWSPWRSRANALLFRVDAVPDVHERFAVERTRTADGAREPFTRAQFARCGVTPPSSPALTRQCSDIDSHLDGRQDVRDVRHGQLLPRRPRDRHNRTGADACRRRAIRWTTGDGPQPPWMGPAVGPRPGHSRPPPARQWGHVRDRRRDARRVSWTDRRTRRLLGGALELLRFSPTRPIAGRRRRPRHHWTPEAGPVASDGNRQRLAIWAGANRTPARATLRQAKGRPGNVERGASNITLVPRLGPIQQPREAMLVTAPLFFGFGLILLIACANIANLLSPGPWCDSGRLATGCHSAPPAAASFASC